MKTYQPSKKILERYAKVLVHFGLNDGKGMKRGDTVLVHGSEASKPLYAEVVKEIIRSGGHVIEQYDLDDPAYNLKKFFYQHANTKQLKESHETYYQGLMDTIDHSINIICEAQKNELGGVDPKKIIQRTKAMEFYKNLRLNKEQAGKYSWTLALYGTEAMAQEAGLSIKEYWKEIIRGCFLNHTDPIAKWKEVNAFNKKTAKKLNKLNIEKLHIQGEDVDLHITLSPKSKWITGAGSNIPSFEIFTSPDWRGTEGNIYFNQPLYRYGNKIEGIELEFKKGKVVKATAKKNEKVLKEMIKVKNADKIGEFSLTDTRVSKITHFMAETLYDENMGGAHGNTHIALGSSFKDAYKGDYTKVSDEEYESLGYNQSAVHTDIISTSNRSVTAHLQNGSTRVIYENGSFTI